jgi:hypothetical protein
MRIFLAFIIVIHGLIHLLGFTKAFNLAQVDQLTQTIPKPIGLLWLLTAILFVTAALLFSFGKESWPITGALAFIISQILIIYSWDGAKYGTIVNFILLIPLIAFYANNLPTSYKNVFKFEVGKGLKRSSANVILKEEEISCLPSPVQKYIIYSGAIGKEKLQNFRAVFQGGIKPSAGSNFLDFHSVQYNFFDNPTRAFYIKSKMYGIPFDGLHLYSGQNATMQIKIASLFQVADAKGIKMNKSETVTMFNDMCFFAPASLIDKNIEWETIDSLKVKAKFTNQGNTIAAILFFNNKGELINFSSFDRYETADGKIYNNYEWTTPVKNYKENNGRKTASYGEAIWHKPEGEFCYGKFNLLEIEYNCKEFMC